MRGIVLDRVVTANPHRDEYDGPDCDQYGNQDPAQRNLQDSAGKRRRPSR